MYYDNIYEFARENGWTIIPSENHALNALGLDTQVPAKIVFTSTGPDSTCKIDGLTVRFDHSDERYLTELQGRAQLLIHAMSWLEHFYATDKWQRASELLNEEEKQHLREHLDCIPAWMLPYLKQYIFE